MPTYDVWYSQRIRAADEATARNQVSADLRSLLDSENNMCLQVEKVESPRCDECPDKLELQHYVNE